MTDHDLTRDELIESAITRALDALFPHAPAATLHRTRVEHQLRIVAQQAASAATDMALLDLMTTDDMAAELGVSVRRVRALARARGVGWQTGRDWVFRRQEIPLLRPGPVGRPRGD